MPTQSQIQTARTQIINNLSGLYNSSVDVSLDMLQLILLSLIADSGGGGGGGGGSSGTQYIESNTDNPATGSVVLFRRADGTLKALQGDNSDRLKIAGEVSFATGSSVNQSGIWDIRNISGTVSLPTGAATDAVLQSVRDRLPSSLDNGKLQISNALAPSVAISGSKTITASNAFENLTASAILRSGVWVQADTTNTGLVSVRYTGATDGLVLEKKDSFFFAIDNPSSLQVAVSVAGEKIRWWGS